jgi:CRP-like cAMP-binding protein
MTTTRTSRSLLNENRLLASLPDSEFEHVQPYLEAVRLRQRANIYEPGDPVDYVYFPLSGVLSSLIVLEDGAEVEVSTSGNEGMAPVTFMFGLHEASYRLLVQVPGEAVRVDAATFRRLLQTNPNLQTSMGRFLTATFTLVAQSAACNRLHPIQERCARWLLMTHDRVNSDSFPITQEFLSDMLGARRPSVTVAAGMLRAAGLIEYRRGRVTVLDRQGLEDAACECYGVVQEAFDNLLSLNHISAPPSQPRNGE